MTQVGKNSLGTRSTLTVGGKEYAYYSLAKASETIGDISRLPTSMKVLLENMLRFEDGRSVTPDDIKAFGGWLTNGKSDQEIAFRPGRVLLQTHQPENPVLKALADWDRDGFLAEEASARERQGMPPFGRLAGLIVSAADPNQADMVASRIGRAAPDLEGVAVLGPAPAPLALLRGRHRRRLLLKTRREVNIQAVLREWLTRVEIPSAVRVTVDIDPYSFL